MAAGPNYSITRLLKGMIKLFANKSSGHESKGPCQLAETCRTTFHHSFSLWQGALCEWCYEIWAKPYACLSVVNSLSHPEGQCFITLLVQLLQSWLVTQDWLEQNLKSFTTRSRDLEALVPLLNTHFRATKKSVLVIVEQNTWGSAKTPRLHWPQSASSARPVAHPN